ncbi:hypothetical protein SSCG_06246 [Streptomyces clavuligerus]|nr:hypothetical protein SSCG_06246 [Streptomyces clavuligerus]
MPEEVPEAEAVPASVSWRAAVSRGSSAPGTGTGLGRPVPHALGASPPSVPLVDELAVVPVRLLSLALFPGGRVAVI